MAPAAWKRRIGLREAERRYRAWAMLGKRRNGSLKPIQGNDLLLVTPVLYGGGCRDMN
jgi:hypothetical protein